MSECRIAKTCPFYNNQANKQAKSLSEWLRYQYCRGNYAMCARHTLHEAMGQDLVPADLYPNEQLRAQQILWRANLQRGGIRRFQ
jgi:hypothetical protein